MSKESNIAAAAGIAVNGKGEKSKAVESAMRLAALEAHVAGHDDAKVRAAIYAARAKAKRGE